VVQVRKSAKPACNLLIPRLRLRTKQLPPRAARSTPPLVSLLDVSSAAARVASFHPNSL
jgi:hypothetical protein